MEDTVLRNAQFRKFASIAFFNAVNSSLQAIALLPKKKTFDKKNFEALRDYFLEGHQQYYAKVIESIGAPYKAKESIEKLGGAKTLDELKLLWRNLSADERADGEIRSAVQELKLKFKDETVQKITATV